MKKLLIFCLLIPFVQQVCAMEDTLQIQAETDYVAGNYKDAVKNYELLLQKGESADLYYNLGNAYFKSGENSRAILNYERALLLNPGFTDAHYNLRIAQRKIVDKIDELPELFLVRWYKSLISAFSADQWGWISIGFFLLMLISIGFFIYSSNVFMKKTGFTTSIVSLLIFVFTLMFAFKQTERFEQRREAIIMSPSVTVKGSPDESGTSLFVIHEGLKVNIKEKLGQWYNIRLQDGNEGWISMQDAEII
ncbi:MAG: tetratricopeptide repeat protein [Culturomica sp.]|jgi:tetratricopeptide (TPR) repeat protein|nr:tetratricopeptide repeat protein [Culturomica sp.]